MSAFPLETAAHPEEPAPRRHRAACRASRATARSRCCWTRTTTSSRRGCTSSSSAASRSSSRAGPYWEVPVMVQRLCGICPVSHHLAACKAMDMMVGATTLTPTAEKIRRLMHYGQILQSHALHFFHLSSPDLLFGFGSDMARRNIVGVAAAYPEIAQAGRAAAQVRPGSHPPHRGQAHPRHRRGPGRREQEPDCRRARRAAEGHLPDDRLEPRRGAAGAGSCSSRTSSTYRNFGTFEARTLSLVRADGAMDLYHGGLRAQRRGRHDDLRPRGLRPLLGADLRGSEALVVHEVPVPARARLARTAGIASAR